MNILKGVQERETFKTSHRPLTLLDPGMPMITSKICISGARAQTLFANQTAVPQHSVATGNRNNELKCNIYLSGTFFFIPSFTGKVPEAA